MTTAEAERLLMSGRGAEAIGLLRTLADKDGRAAALTANIAAWGVLCPRDLAGSLAFLERAAVLGWAPAQGCLRLLACEQDASDWGALRRRIDLGALIAAPAPRTLSESPRARVFEGFATAAECDWLVARARGGLRRAQVHASNVALSTSEVRTNSEADFSFLESDVATCLVRDRIAAAARAHERFFEVMKLLHYEPGQEFARHADYFELTPHYLEHEIGPRGQRAATFLLYLNDDYEGGETVFPDAGVRYKGRKGDALLFLNVDKTGAPDPASIHAGSAPTRGEKWILSQWIRSKPINVFMTPGVSTAPLGADWLANA
ncbi:MAG: 2OG-Fe(II) oxygenase [Hyphomonadaceae bacterium]|nr:2OG-Fe(II) oxygenase [Hyphomonadaceae bacterium]